MLKFRPHLGSAECPCQKRLVKLANLHQSMSFVCLVITKLRKLQQFDTPTCFNSPILVKALFKLKGIAITKCF